MSAEAKGFRPGGTLDPASDTYIVRSADAELYAAVSAGELVYVLDSRQKGKSSLVARTIQRLRADGIHTVKIDLQRIGANVSVEQWYAGILTAFGSDLDLLKEVFEHWAANQHLGPLARLFDALERVILAKIPGTIVVFIDEVDFVRALPFSADEFFAGIRQCFNRRAENPELNRIAFCLVGVATPSQLIRNPSITPFNVGRRIELTDFSRADLDLYRERLSVGGRDSAPLLDRIHHWVSGHPYLTQLLCGLVEQDPRIRTGTDVDELVGARFLGAEARHSEPNLADLERRVLEPAIPGLAADEGRSRLLQLYGEILRGQPIAADTENPLVEALKLSGLASEAGGKLQVRNRLYARIFDAKWQRSSLPDAETKRLRATARRAVLKTSLVAGTILLALATLTFRVLSVTGERNRALVQARAQTDASERIAYERTMYLISVEAAADNWIRAAELLESVDDSRWRGWEWGYWKNILSSSRVLKGPDSDPRNWMFAVWYDKFDKPFYLGENLVELSPSPRIIGDVPAQITSQRWILSLGRRLSAEQVRERLVRANVDKMVLDAQESSGPIELLYDPKSGDTLLSRNGTTRTIHRGIQTTSPNGVLSKHGRYALYRDDAPHEQWLIDLRTLTRQRIAEGLNMADFSPDESMIAIASNDPTVALYRTSDASRVGGLVGHKGPVKIVKFFDDGSRIFTTGSDGTVRFWDTATREQVRMLLGPRHAVVAADVSVDGLRLLTASISGEVREWDLSAPDQVESTSPHRDQIHLLRQASTGRRMATASMDGTAALVSAIDRQVVARFKTKTPPRPDMLAFTSDGTRLVLCGDDGAVRIVNAETGVVDAVYEDARHQFEGVSISHSGQSVVAVARRGAVVLDTKALRKICDIQEDAELKRASINADGKLVATSGVDGAVRLWDADAGSLVRELDKARFMVVGLTFSKSSEWLAAASNDNGIYLYNLRDPSKSTVLLGHESRAWGSCFSPDERLLLTHSFDGTARLWEVSSGKQLSVLRHGSWVPSAVFSPDGSRIVTASADGVAKVWVTATGSEVCILRGHSQPVFDASFTPDGRDIVTVSNDKTLRVWSGGQAQLEGLNETARKSR